MGSLGLSLLLGLAAPRLALAAPKAPAAGASAEAEFEVVAAGDDLYRLLALVQRGGLLQSAPRGGATRYEVALEVGRATLALASKRAAQARVSEDAAKALSELLARLRPELRRLDVDVDAALLLCRANASAQALPASGPRSNAGEARDAASSLGTARLMAAPRSLAQRLRDSAYQTLHARDSSDPFGGAVERSRSFFGPSASNRSGAASFEPVNAGPHGVYPAEGSLGASVDVIGGLRVRAGLAASGPSARAGALRALGDGSADAALASPDGSSRSVGVGADLDLPAGVTLSGDVARLSTGLAAGGAGGLGTSFAGAGGFDGTRIGGQARVSAFNDRLELSANWARLMPEQQANFGAQSSSSAGLGVSAGNQNFKLKLLYQQLFGPSSSGQTNRVIAGGVAISF